MTVKEFLYQAFILDKRIKAMETQLLRLKEQRTSINAILIRERIQASPKMDRIGAVIASIDELELDYLSKVEKLNRLKKHIEMAVENLRRDDYRLILEERYINLKTWEAIAADNGCCCDTAHRKHREALENIQIEIYEIG